MRPNVPRQNCSSPGCDWSCGHSRAPFTHLGRQKFQPKFFCHLHHARDVLRWLRFLPSRTAQHLTEPLNATVPDFLLAISPMPPDFNSRNRNPLIPKKIYDKHKSSDAEMGRLFCLHTGRCFNNRLPIGQ
jgi:hypothetical protein